MPNHLIAKTQMSSILSYLALFIIADQLLLPVPRLFGHSLFKPSYWLLFAWPFFLIVFKNKFFNTMGWGSRFFKMTGPVMGILIFGLLGQLALSTMGSINDPNEAVRASMFYLLMILSFGFGQIIPNFRYRWLLWLLYAIIALIILLTFAIERFPILVQLYYYTPENIDRMIEGFSFRVRGLGNPNSTMLLVNIMFLFLVVSIRKGYLERLKLIHIVLMPILNIGLCIIMGSRNQLIVSIVLIIFFLSTRNKQIIKKIIMISVYLVTAIIVVNYLVMVLIYDYPFIEWAYNRILNTNVIDSSNNQSETIYRPLIHWKGFYDRFLESPIIGSGYSTMFKYPFDKLPNFHNDWFRVWATSGAIGGSLFFVWMFRIFKNFGLLLLLPFFLPGLTNSFLRDTPSVIIYCFMLGILIEQKFHTKAQRIIKSQNQLFNKSIRGR
jgi:hypothetical protein